MNQDIVISKRILEDMTDGVMAIDLSGKIITINRAATELLGIRKEEVEDRTFGEVFFLTEGNDDFNQVILDAIYESSKSHNQVVDFNCNGKRIILSLTTTFLKTEGEANQRIGVIAIFNDITEVRALQEAEARMAEELRSKHRELQDAYLKMEGTNASLQAALKKVQIIRIAATAFTIVLFLSIGLYLWNRNPLGEQTTSLLGAAAAIPAQGAATLTVAPQAISSTINLNSKFQPLETINITSPLAGKVLNVSFRYGNVVKAGQTLLTMDTAETEVKFREAKAAHIKAVANYQQMEKWESGSEVIRAKRSLTKAKLSLDNQKKALDETERLFKMGIVPATEYESAKHQAINQQLDFQSAEEEVRAAVDKGNTELRKIARYEMDNAASRLKQLESELANAVIVAPVGGIVMKPGGGGTKANEARLVEKGAAFQQGEVLVAIGDLSGLSVESKVDEVDLTKVKVGQKVRVSGDALPNISLDGVVRSISPQAEEGDNRGAPSFGISVVVNNVTPEQMQRIFVGMSANLEIILFEKPDALLVPITAVANGTDGRYVLKKTSASPTAPAEKVKVETGITTLDSVEIVKGLNAGDVIEVASPVPGGENPQPGMPERKGS